jgi:hypothetical protein
MCWQYTTSCNAAAVAAKMCPSTLLGFASTTYGAFNSAAGGALAQCAAQAPMMTSVQYDAASACATNDCNKPPSGTLAPPMFGGLFGSGAATTAGTTVLVLLAASVAALAVV